MAWSDKDLEEMAGTLHTAIATGEGSALENEAIAIVDDLIAAYHRQRDLLSELAHPERVLSFGPDACMYCNSVEVGRHRSDCPVGRALRGEEQQGDGLYGL